MKSQTLEKLKTLANAAKFDVSCSSSGSSRTNTGKGIGNAAPWGICHSFTEDGRCVSLLKIMMTNYCKFDCAYCINRKSNDIPRTSFSVSELVELTIEFYRRNYIEGLFLSSGVVKDADHTMTLMTNVAKELRTIHNYNGYIHLKSIPGASSEIIRQAGMYADRLSVNIEIPTENNLKMLAPEKDFSSILKPMSYISQGILENKEDRGKQRSVPKFVPAGQSTQLIVGATPDNDNSILQLATSLYSVHKLKRVYYSGYIPVNAYDKRLPALTEPPLIRENRLYQADWLMRFYHFKVDEIVSDKNPFLDLDVDPKLSYALRNPWLFPVDMNKASYETILRVPGIGVKSAQLIISSRKFCKIGSEHLKKMGVALKRAQYFITCNELPAYSREGMDSANFRDLFTKQMQNINRRRKTMDGQLKLQFV